MDLIVPSLAELPQYAGALRRGRSPDNVRLDAAAVEELAKIAADPAAFVASLDDPEAKEPIISALKKFGIPFVDVGMGVEMIDGRLTGILRTTTGTPEKYDHVESRISFAQATADKAAM